MFKATSAKDGHDVPGILDPTAGTRARSWPATAWRDTLPRPCRRFGAVLALCLVAGCATVPMAGPDRSADVAPPPPAPLFAFLASADADEVGTVEDPRTGQSVRVLAGRAYHAASGRLCRRFAVMSPHGYEGMTEGLACKDEHGRWTKSELLINPDDLDAPRLQLP